MPGSLLRSSTLPALATLELKMDDMASMQTRGRSRAVVDFDKPHGKIINKGPKNTFREPTKSIKDLKGKLLDFMSL